MIPKDKTQYILPPSTKNLYRTCFYGLLLPSLFLLIYISQLHEIFPLVELNFNVYKSSLQLTFGEHQYWYLMINLAVLFFPLILSFDQKVHFYKKWKFILPAILFNGIFFVIWDIYFTHLGIWGFNEKYIEVFLLNLPLGEWLFFIIVPYACVFIHECLTVYIKRDLLANIDKGFTILLALCLIIIGLWHGGQLYTMWAFLLSGTFLLFHYFFIANTYRTRFYLSYIVSIIPFTLTNGILTGMFNENPVVLYNDTQNLTASFGTRFFSIPIDDFAYSFLLIFIPVTLYEQLKTTYKNQK